MANISASAVNELRQATGCGLMDCKKALVECDGDMDKAVTYLREKGLASQAKKATRVAAEGMAYATVIDGVGVVLEVNCESDFVAGNDLFKDFVSGVAAVIAKSNPADIDELMDCPWFNGNGTVADAKNELFLSVRENMQIRRFSRIDTGVCVPYVHMKGKVAVLVNLETEASADSVNELGKDIAMQICALNPAFLDKSQVDSATLEKEKEIQLAVAREENSKLEKPKPDAIIEKMVMGRMSKYYKENCLMQQDFVKDPSMSVEQYVESVAASVGASIALKNAVRFEKGEGIEKRQDDLAAEVAKMVK